jgi:hypothetical protein
MGVVAAIEFFGQNGQPSRTVYVYRYGTPAHNTTVPVPAPFTFAAQFPIFKMSVAVQYRTSYCTLHTAPPLPLILKHTSAVSANIIP